MAKHNLKCWHNSFDAIRDGRKRFTWRKDDRGFEVGDILELWKWDPGMYGGQGGYVKLPASADAFTPTDILRVRVSYILRGMFGIPAGYCIMSIEPIEDADGKG